MEKNDFTMNSDFGDNLYLGTDWTVKQEYYTDLENKITSSQSNVANSFFESWFSANDCMLTWSSYPNLEGPRQIAKLVNKEMFGRLTKRQNQGNYGIIVMDFPPYDLIEKIIKENF